MQRQNRGVAIIHVVLGLVAFGAITLASSTSLGWSWTKAWVALTTPGPTSLTSEMRLILAESRLTPETLAAAGVTPEDIAPMVGRICNWWPENGNALIAERQQAHGKRRAIDLLEARLRSGTSSPTDLSALQRDRADATQASQTFRGRLDQLWNDATSGLDASVVERLRCIRVNLDAKRGLPIKYLVIEWNAPDALNLQRSLATVATLPDEDGAARIVSAADNNSATVQAATWIQLHAPAIASEWSNADK